MRIAAYEVGGLQEGRWVLARDLREGDEVLLRHGEVALESVRLDEVEETVYNFHVAELQNYAVGDCGVLVHNSSDPPSRSGASKNDAHGHQPGTKLVEQVQQLEDQLAELNRTQGSAREKAQIRQKIINLNKKIDRMIKGETHDRR